MDAQVISIITDSCGNIISNNKFLPFFKLAFTELELMPNQRKLLVNTLDKNYLIYKLQLNIGSYSYFQYLIEEWRMDNSLNSANQLKFKYNKNDFSYDSLSALEQEIIYSLLSGYIADKEVEGFLRHTMGSKLKGNIKYIISTLYLRFDTDSRTDLIKLLKLNGFDRYLPPSLFPPGIYDI